MRRLLSFIFILLLLTGCKSDERILEKLGMVQSASFDLLEDKRLKATYCIPVIDPDSAVRREMLNTESDSLKEARLIFSRETDLRVVSGQLRNTLFGLTVAKSGLEEHMDTLLRDPSIALGVKVTVVEGDAGDLLNKEFKPHTDTGRYINHLLEKEGSSNSIPPITLYEFTRDYHDDGIDPVAPMVKDAGDKAEIAGTALFRDDRYMMKVPARDGIIFALLRGGMRQGEASLNLGEENGRKIIVLFNSMQNKRKVKVNHMDGDKYKVIIDASVQGSVLEYTGKKDLSKSKNRHELEREIADTIRGKADKIIKEMQKNNVDSLGIGQYIRNSLSYNAWKNLNWRKVYPEIEIECRVKVLIKDYGKYM